MVQGVDMIVSANKTSSCQCLLSDQGFFPVVVFLAVIFAFVLFLLWLLLSLLLFFSSVVTFNFAFNAVDMFSYFLIVFFLMGFLMGSLMGV